VTLNVEPHINVIAMRYLSALGKSVLPLLLPCMLAVSSFLGCGNSGERTLPEKEFEQIYGDIIFLGELHRDDTLALRAAVDSMLYAHGTDSTALLATARSLADDPQSLNDIYRNIILRFEAIAAADSSVKETPVWEQRE
jgi:hypothetical protein